MIYNNNTVYVMYMINTSIYVIILPNPWQNEMVHSPHSLSTLIILFISTHYYISYSYEYMCNNTLTLSAQHSLNRNPKP